MKRGLSTGDITTAALYDCDDDDGHGVFTQTRGQRKKSKKRDVNATKTKTKQSAVIIPTSEAAMSQQIFSSTVIPASAVVDKDEQSEVHESTFVSGLKKEVDQLRGTVRQLQAKVEFLLSFVGIPESAATSSSVTSAPSVAVPHFGSIADTIMDTSQASAVRLSVEREKTGIQLSDNEFPVLGHPPATSQSAMNYVGAARQTTNLQTVQNSFRDAVVAAVYVDRRRSEQRANSFIVTGISESLSHSDKNTVFELCASELGIEVDIIACKRLGRVQSERRRPILVVCKSVDCVADVLACAKLLRNSVDPEVKRMVYINPNLTKAEARAAYELRCQRRLSVQRRASQQHVSNRDVLNQGASNGVFTEDPDMGLNVNAAEWQPNPQQQRQQQQSLPSAGSSEQ